MFKKITKFLFKLSLIGAVIGALAVVGLYFYVKPSLPEVETLREVKLQQPMRVLSADGKLITQFGEKRRIPVTYDEIPQQMVHALISSEDDRFFKHPGVDWKGIARAVWVLTTTGEKRVGGSTITMQVAREFFLSRKKDYMRKVREIFLALKMEKELSKEEILTLYANKTFLGQRAYGVAAAARVYYGKTLDELTLAEIAIISGIPQAPSRLNPVSNPEDAKRRRAYVLRRMLEQGYINQTEHDEANATPIETYVHRAEIEVEAPHIAEMVRDHALELFGEAIYSDGYQIVTTVKSKLQNHANLSLRKALHEYDERHGFRRVGGQIDVPENPDELLETDWRKLFKDYPDLGLMHTMLVLELNNDTAKLVDRSGQRHELTKTGIEWAKAFVNRDRIEKDSPRMSELLQTGDIIYVIEALDKDDNPMWRLAQSPEPEGALIALHPNTGAMLAMSSGYDFIKSKFNRVTQAQRQPGSSFKPFVYSAALENNFHASSLFNDAPIVFEDDQLETTWRPQNSSQKFYGPTRMREALVKSRNLVSIRILQEVGINNTVDYLTRFAFPEEQIDKDLSLALGSAAMSPLQMARAYAAIANGGFLVEPFYIERIEDAQGNVVFEAAPKRICRECKYRAKHLPEVTVNDATEAGDFPLEGVFIASNDVRSKKPAEQKIETRVYDRAPRVMTPENAFIIQSMMREVVRRGTATKAQALGRTDLAGKTGTTNDQRDAWFSGFVPELATVSWVGFDDMQQLGRREYGAVAALPMWIDFMQVALEDIPVTDFENLVPPRGIVKAEINPESGLLVRLANDDLSSTTSHSDITTTEMSYDQSSQVNYSGPTMEEYYFSYNLPEYEKEEIEDIFFFEGETVVTTTEDGEETIETEEESLF